MRKPVTTMICNYALSTKKNFKTAQVTKPSTIDSHQKATNCKKNGQQNSHNIITFAATWVARWYEQ